MCDAWLGFLLAGDRASKCSPAHGAAVRTGWETRRLGVTDLQFRPEVSTGYLATGDYQRRFAGLRHAAVLARPSVTRRRQSCSTPPIRHPFDAELVSYVQVVLPHQTLA